MDMEHLTFFIEKEGGIVTFTQLKQAGFAPGLITYAYKIGRIDKLTRGVYSSPGVFEDDFSIIGFRWRKCVFSHASGLYLQGLSDRVPATISVTVPRGYNPHGLKEHFPDIEIHRLGADLYDLGVTTVETPAGNTVACYGAERCIADIIKLRKARGVDSQVVRDAITGYFKREKKDLQKLASMCEELGVRNELQVYLEVF